MRIDKKSIHVLFIAVLACLLTWSCKKEIVPQIIGVSDELSAYEKYVEDIRTGRIDSSAFLYTKDGGFLYYSRESQWIAPNRYQDILSISKSSYSNNLLWNISYNYEYDDGGGLGYSPLLETSDGSILFSATTIHVITNSDTEREVEQDIILLKYDKNGKLLWEKKYDFADNASVYTINETSDKGYILVGVIETSDDQFLNIIKTTITGEIEWNKTISNGKNRVYPGKVIQTTDKGFLILFQQEFYCPQSNNNVGLIKLNKNGEIVNCNKSVFMTNSYFAFRHGENGLIVANDGGYINAEFHYRNSTLYDLIITKLDDDGEVIWQKVNKLYSSDYPGVVHMMSIFNSGYFLVLVYRDGFDNIYSIIKFNNSGDLLE